jgi:hypothetical protein
MRTHSFLGRTLETGVSETRISAARQTLGNGFLVYEKGVDACEQRDLEEG